MCAFSIVSKARYITIHLHADFLTTGLAKGVLHVPVVSIQIFIVDIVPTLQKVAPVIFGGFFSELILNVECWAGTSAV
jgi:hypothetical protein